MMSFTSTVYRHHCHSYLLLKHIFIQQHADTCIFINSVLIILADLAMCSCMINPVIHVLVLWVMTLCSLVGHYQHFRWSSCCLYMYFNPQGGHNQENQNMNPHHHQNLKFCVPLHLLPVMNFTILSSSCQLEIVVNISLSNVCLADFL